MIEFYFDDMDEFFDAVDWCYVNLKNGTCKYLPGLLSKISTVRLYNHDDAILFRLRFDAMHCEVGEVRDLARPEV